MDGPERIAILGVPTEVGTSEPGSVMGPAALRTAGLVRTLRDLGVLAGVTINALAVLDEEADLLDHYRGEVIGGRSSFVVACDHYRAFARAVRAKLMREIPASPLAA